MDTAAAACRPICSRPSAITSALTPTSAWISRAASSSTRTGQERAERSRPESMSSSGASPDQITQLASKIRLLLMDVDGVLTDGKLFNVPAPDGSMAETKGFDSQDGIGLQWLAKVGIVTGLISGRVSPATVERARQCKFKYVYQGHTEKIPIIEEIMADAKIDASEAAYIGDDFTDVVI